MFPLEKGRSEASPFRPRRGEVACYRGKLGLLRDGHFRKGEKEELRLAPLRERNNPMVEPILHFEVAFTKGGGERKAGAKRSS